MPLGGNAQLHRAGSTCQALGNGLISIGRTRAERVALDLGKRLDTVVATFGASAAGGVFVPVNPILKPEQVGYILQDCNVLVTSRERFAALNDALATCHDLRHVVLPGDPAEQTTLPGACRAPGRHGSPHGPARGGRHSAAGLTSTRGAGASRHLPARSSLLRSPGRSKPCEYAWCACASA